MNAIVRISARSSAIGVGAFSTWLAQQLLGHVFLSGIAYTPPGTLFAALYVDPPSAAGGGTEVAGDPSYRRMPVPFVAGSGPGASVANGAQLIWPNPRVDWGAVAALGLFDLAGGGNFLNYGLLLDPTGAPTTVPVTAGGEPFVVDTGALFVGLA